MKIAYLHQYYVSPTSPTGGGTRSYEFARRLAELVNYPDIPAPWHLTALLTSLNARKNTRP